MLQGVYISMGSNSVQHYFGDLETFPLHFTKIFSFCVLVRTQVTDYINGKECVPY